MDADSPELDDTVIGVVRTPPAAPEDLDEDTVVRDRETPKSVSRDASAPTAPPALVDPPAPVDLPEPVGPPELVDPLAGTEPAPRVLTPPAGERAPVAQAPAASPRAAATPRVPAHGIRIGEHEPILLDVPALIGRRPSRPRILSAEVPRLVRVPSPASEISATHLEVRQEGTTVVVTDLGSTNGTLVHSPAIAPRKLRQGESLVVAVGTVVDIGDGIRIEILPASEAAQ